MNGLTGKVTLITGAASGIGRAIALRLGEEGCAVGIFDLDQAGAAATEQQIIAGGGRALALHVDITDYELCEKGVAEVESQLGPVDVLVNNAGWDKAVPFLQSDVRPLEKSDRHQSVRTSQYAPRCVKGHGGAGNKGWLSTSLLMQVESVRPAKLFIPRARVVSSLFQKRFLGSLRERTSGSIRFALVRRTRRCSRGFAGDGRDRQKRLSKG